MSAMLIHHWPCRITNPFFQTAKDLYFCLGLDAYLNVLGPLDVAIHEFNERAPAGAFYGFDRHFEYIFLVLYGDGNPREHTDFRTRFRPNNL